MVRLPPRSTRPCTLFPGAALPRSLSFDAASRTFSGTPGNAEVGNLNVRVTATDLSGTSVSDDFELTVSNVNDRPTLANPLADQNAAENAAFSYRVPTGSFADVDVGDTLSYSARLSSGANLPTWLSFDAASRTFSGTPGNAEVGNLNVRVTATDLSGTSVSDDFELTVSNVNDAPTGLPVIDGRAVEDQLLTANTSSMGDVDGLGTLTFQWLRDDRVINDAAGSTYLLGDADVGTHIRVRVSYTDGRGSDEVLLSAASGPVGNINDAPVAALSLRDQVATESAAFSFALPAEAFTDVDIGDTLSYRATLASGAALPAWLRFDPATRTLSGLPTNGDLGIVNVVVSATDQAGAMAQTGIAVVVSRPLDVVPIITDPPVLDEKTSSAEAQTTPKAPAVIQSASLVFPEINLAMESALGLDQALALSVQLLTPEIVSRNDGSDLADTSRLFSRADSVLVDPLLTQFNQIALASPIKLSRSDEMIRKFEELQRRAQEQVEDRRATIGSSIAVTGGLSLGYVVWLVRGGVLMSSMLSALPAWQMIDPMPVLSAARSRKNKQDDKVPDDREMEKLFDQRGRSEKTRSPSPQAAQGASGQPNQSQTFR
jgi:hypothetical protein